MNYKSPPTLLYFQKAHLSTQSESKRTFVKSPNGWLDLCWINLDFRAESIHLSLWTLNLLNATVALLHPLFYPILPLPSPHPIVCYLKPLLIGKQKREREVAGAKCWALQMDAMAATKRDFDHWMEREGGTFLCNERPTVDTIVVAVFVVGRDISR